MFISSSSIVSDAELSGQTQSDPGSFSQTHILTSATIDNSPDSTLEPRACSQVPPILLSVCGGLGDDGELSHGMSKGEGGNCVLGLCVFQQSGVDAFTCVHVCPSEYVQLCWLSLPTSDKVRVGKVLNVISGEKENTITKAGIQLLRPT